MTVHCILQLLKKYKENFKRAQNCYNKTENWEWKGEVQE